ncbi:MAG TPA: hypothetical protein VGD26_06530 [Chitinophagaceae bacterium]
MIVLPTNTTKLEITLTGAVATTQPYYTVNYEVVDAAGTSTFLSTSGQTNDTSVITALAAPVLGGTRRIVRSIHVHNADTNSQTVVITLDNNGTNYTLFKATLATLECLIYESGNGWTAYTSAGGIK